MWESVLLNLFFKKQRCPFYPKSNCPSKITIMKASHVIYFLILFWFLVPEVVISWFSTWQVMKVIRSIRKICRRKYVLLHSSQLSLALLSDFCVHLLFCTVLVIEWRVLGFLSANLNNLTYPGKERNISFSLRVLTTVHEYCDHTERLIFFCFTYLIYCGNRSCI